MSNPEINDVPAAGDDPPSRDEFGLFALEVSAGAHRGAMFNLEPGDIIAIGSQADCEIILTDDGVDGHHAILTYQSREIWLRAVDAPLQVAGKSLSPGEPRRLAPNERVMLGDATLILIRTARQAPLANPRLKAWMASPRRNVLLVAAVVVLFMAGGWLTSRSIAGAMYVAQLFFGVPAGTETSAAAAGSHPVAMPRPAHAPRTGSAGLADRPGREIAKDVGEVLRLSGISAKTSYLGEGRVKVKGYLSGNKALSRVIHSRAMRDIQGLNQVVAVNFDAQPKAPKPREKKPSRVVAVIDGAAPYLVTNSGDYYYVGAQLPTGYRLAAIQGNQVVTYHGHDIRHQPGVGMLLTSDAIGGNK